MCGAFVAFICVHGADVVLQNAPDSRQGGDLLVDDGHGALALVEHDGSEERRVLQTTTELPKVMLVVCKGANPVARVPCTATLGSVELQKCTRLLEWGAPPMTYEPTWDLWTIRYQFDEGT